MYGKIVKKFVFWDPGRLREAFRRAPEGHQVTFACLLLLVHLGAVLVQMPANHLVKRNSPHVALLQRAYRQTRPEAKLYAKTFEKCIF